MFPPVSNTDQGPPDWQPACSKSPKGAWMVTKRVFKEFCKRIFVVDAGRSRRQRPNICFSVATTHISVFTFCILVFKWMGSTANWCLHSIALRMIPFYITNCVAYTRFLLRWGRLFSFQLVKGGGMIGIIRKFSTRKFLKFFRPLSSAIVNAQSARR